MGGGLGGGSSDAASVLLGLNDIWNCGLSIDALAKLGLPLGADVPVFVRGSSAWVRASARICSPWSYPRAGMWSFIRGPMWELRTYSRA